MARIDLSSETGNNTKRTGGFVSFAVALQEFRVLIYPTVSFTSENSRSSPNTFFGLSPKMKIRRKTIV